MSVGEALAWARALGLDRLDASLLLAQRLRRSREWLLAHPDAELDAEIRGCFEADCRRRADDVPLAYLTGHREFRGLDLRVTPAVLVPRPDTETLADWAIEHVGMLSATVAHPRVVDLGTGSGALALAIAAACPQARVTATECDPGALALAAGNARRLRLEVGWRLGPWWAAFAHGDRFDLVVANPPYVAAGDPHLHALRHEPQHALVAAGAGLADLRHIVAHARPHLAGWLLLEHGCDQADAVHALMATAGLRDIALRRDLQGQPRCTRGRLI